MRALLRGIQSSSSSSASSSMADEEETERSRAGGGAGGTGRGAGSPGRGRKLEEDFPVALRSGPTGRSLLGWAVSMFIGSLMGGILGMSIVRIMAPLVLPPLPPCRRAPLQQPSSTSTPSIHDTESRILQSGMDVNAALRELGLSEELSPGQVKAVASKALEGFVPGTPGNWRDVKELLEQNKRLQERLAESRRAFRWRTKTRLARLKTLLEQLQAIRNRRALTFVVDDTGFGGGSIGDVRSHNQVGADGPQNGQGANGQGADGQRATELLAELRAIEREELDTWQEVDLPASAPPLPVTVRTLREIVQQQLPAPQRAETTPCADVMLDMERLMGKLRTVAEARQEAEAEESLAAQARSRLRSIWEEGMESELTAAWDAGVGNRGFLEAGGGDGDDAALTELQKQRAEFAFWATKYLGLWPWGLVQAGRGAAKQALLGALGSLQQRWRDARERLEREKASAEVQLEEVLAAAPRSCGLTPEELKDVLLASGDPQLGVCSAAPWLTSKDEAAAADGGSTGSPANPTPIAPHYVWKRSSPQSSPPSFRAEAGAPASRAAGLSSGGFPPPVNVSFLVVMQWNQSLGETINYLYGCSYGMRALGQLGPSSNFTSELLIAIDADMLPGHRDRIQDAIIAAKPWFVTHVLFVSTGGTGLSLAHGYNVLLPLATGHIVIRYELGSKPPPSCHWVLYMTRPFQSWPFLGAVGFQFGQMSVYNTPGVDYLDVVRQPNNPSHHRSIDPLSGDRIQFVLAAYGAPTAYLRAALVDIGGFDEEGAGLSNALHEHELCRRLWLARYQVALAFPGDGNRVWLPRQANLESEVLATVPVGNASLSVFHKKLEGRIVAEVKRMNRLLNPLPIWE